MAKKKLKVGELVVRTSDSTALFRVTESPRAGVFRLLPFRRQGSEVMLFQLRGGTLTDGTVTWTRVGE